jgi:hypothetical protein
MYAYVNNDPVNLNDLSGLCAESWDPAQILLTGCIDLITFGSLGPLGPNPIITPAQYDDVHPPGTSFNVYTELRPEACPNGQVVVSSGSCDVPLSPYAPQVLRYR